MTDECPPPCIHPDHILTNAEVRELCGGITRPTLLAWRNTRGFPAPFKTSPGSGGNLELWDARDVQAWLEDQREGVS